MCLFDPCDSQIVDAEDAVACFDVLVQLFLRVNRSPLSTVDSIVPKATELLQTRLPDITEGIEQSRVCRSVCREDKESNPTDR